ncbi:hypothetical protein [uncultured Mediterranean phage uvMED]|nr:hypothetical protein [uncultured Mediterranean phage uvMED]
MAYIGRDISNLSDRAVLDNITTSATATYNLLLNSVAFVPSSAESLTVSLNGVIQKPQSSYTVSGSTIVFDSALTSSDVIDFILAERAITLTTVGSGSVGTSQLVDSAVTNAKITDGTIANAKLANSSITLNGSAVSLGGSATIGGGKIGQVIQTVSTASASISTTSFADVMTAAITPSATSSKILIDFRLGGYNPGDAMDIFFRVERDSTALQTGTAGQGTACQSAGTPNSQRGDGGFSINFLDSPNSTSAITYKLQSKVSGNSYTFNSKSGSYSTISTLTLMEVLV